MVAPNGGNAANVSHNLITSRRLHNYDIGHKGHFVVLIQTNQSDAKNCHATKLEALLFLKCKGS